MLWVFFRSASLGTFTYIVESSVASFNHFSLIHFEKKFFQHFSHTNVWGSKFDHAVKKRSTANLVPNTIYQDSTSKFSWFSSRRFLNVLTINGHGTILFKGEVPFEQILNIP